METLCGKIGYLNSCSCGIYSKPCCPIRLQHQLLQINLKTTFRNSQIHRLTSPVAKFWKEDSLCKDTRPNALIDNLIQGVRTTLCAVTAAALMCSSTAYAEPLTVAFPASKAREVNRVQKTLVEAWGVIRETFVDPTFNHQDWDMKLEQTMNEMLPLKTADAAYSKISNMLATLGDPFTRLINPKEYQSFRIGSDGSLQGVGLFIGADPRSGHLVVLSSIEGSPAARAGIHAGDELIEINGEPIAGMDEQEAAQKLRGRVGTFVTIKLQQGGDSKGGSQIKEIISS